MNIIIDNTICTVQYNKVYCSYSDYIKVHNRSKELFKMWCNKNGINPI
ncbi:hypothetical protein JOC34_000508 [Virgibacillus halotolerans]|nr:hypothetical protein [Virgibacillus halotolerans]